MSVDSFLKLVEIRTKVASILPFLLGNAYGFYRFRQFHMRNFLIMFLSLICFDMATTAINNFMDYKKAKKTHGYNYETHNAIVRDHLKESTVIVTISVLLIVASTAGFMLFLNTDIIILLLGMISFLVGILYSFGPIPISRMPLGEIFSGLFMGFVIVFISTYIHIYDMEIANISYRNGMIILGMNMKEILYIFLISIPAVIGIANIMLANNICDIEDDMVNKRYTLPIYIGKDRALRLFRILYYISYIDLLILLILRITPILSLLMIFTLIPVNKNIKIFKRTQTKGDTFVTAVENFVLINLVYILVFSIGILL